VKTVEGCIVGFTSASSRSTASKSKRAIAASASVCFLTASVKTRQSAVLRDFIAAASFASSSTSFSLFDAYEKGREGDNMRVYDITHGV